MPSGFSRSCRCPSTLSGPGDDDTTSMAIAAPVAGSTITAPTGTSPRAAALSASASARIIQPSGLLVFMTLLLRPDGTGQGRRWFHRPHHGNIDITSNTGGSPP